MAELLSHVDENGPAFEQDKILYETYASIGEKTLNLTDMIVDRYRDTQQHITKMALVPKGAYLMGSILPERLGISNDQLVHLPVQSYSGQEQMYHGKLIISRHMPSREEVEGEDFLLGDEVWESGRTIDFAARYLSIMGAASVCVATLIFKPGKNKVPDGHPDLHVAETELWTDFPWERERRLRQPATDISRRRQEPIIIDPEEYLEKLRTAA